jgi:ribonuclease P protein component
MEENLKILSITSSIDFQKINKKGKKFYSQSLILITSPAQEIHLQNLEKNKNVKDFCRVGYTVAKTVSKSAIIRNQAKRRLREAFRSLIIHAKNNQDYILIARKEITSFDFKKIISDLKFCLTRIHQPKNNKDPQQHDKQNQE